MGKHKHSGYNLLTVIPASLSVLQKCFAALEFLWWEPGLSVTRNDSMNCRFPEAIAIIQILFHVWKALWDPRDEQRTTGPAFFMWVAIFLWSPKGKAKKRTPKNEQKATQAESFPWENFSHNNLFPHQLECLGTSEKPWIRLNEAKM